MSAIPSRSRGRTETPRSKLAQCVKRCVVLLFHGDVDPMPLSQSTRFVDALRAAGERVLRWLDQHIPDTGSA
jgi:hypothetical protein